MEGELEQEKQNICQYLIDGNCKHGISGRKHGNCVFHHPQICDKYRIHGKDLTHGCPSKKQCGLLHQKKCKNEKYYNICRNKECQSRHTLDTDLACHSNPSGRPGYWVKGEWCKSYPREYPFRALGCALNTLASYIKRIINRQIEELEKELECPVCLEVANSPIYKCEDDHLVCSGCRTKMSECPVCRTRYPDGGPKRFRGAERSSEKLTNLYVEHADIIKYKKSD